MDGTHFALNGDGVSYRFHVDNTTGDLIGDHFGGMVTENTYEEPIDPIQGWVNLVGRERREFPDLGRGDFRIPAVQIRQSAGYQISAFQYKSHDVMQGKPSLNGLPSTFGKDDEVSTLVVHMYDNTSDVAADLSYSVFPKFNAIVRSVNITNHGSANITIERLSSFSVDLPYGDYDMIQLRGDWAREAQRQRRHVEYGTQGFASSAGYSSHFYNPFLAIVDPTATETQGEAWGFSLIYTGSFAVEIERGSHGITRATMGLNPEQLSWPLAPKETFTSPEVVAIYSNSGIGEMSRNYHRLFRNHLIKSKHATETRPPLLNSWEGLGFDYNETRIARLAQQTADFGIKMFVLDDGWFGNEYPRNDDHAGLGDWQVNTKKFPDGLPALVKNVTSLKVNGTNDKLRFGLWFEPEMVNPNSTLYHEHPEWALHAGDYQRTLTRNQLVLNVALPEVQDFIVESVGNILGNSSISYVKWDNNRGMHEMPQPYTGHQYMLGMYKVFERLTSKFPDVLWEGCASGGGRFDPGVLQFFPQIWTSDDTDAVERVGIQFGTSLVYPPSAMAGHVSHVPNGSTDRSTPILFRAHVAMMTGSFGFELNPDDMSAEDHAAVPDILELAAKVNPIVIQGDMYRLRLPEESNWPSALFVTEDGSKAVLFAFQMRSNYNNNFPHVRLQGLDPKAKYTFDGNQTLSGQTLMNSGVRFNMKGDMDSRVVLIEKQ